MREALGVRQIEPQDWPQIAAIWSLLGARGVNLADGTVTGGLYRSAIEGRDWHVARALEQLPRSIIGQGIPDELRQELPSQRIAELERSPDVATRESAAAFGVLDAALGDIDRLTSTATEYLSEVSGAMPDRTAAMATGGAQAAE